LKKLESIFRHKVLKMLLSRGKITRKMIDMLSTWRHYGFNVFCGNRISSKDDASMLLSPLIFNGKYPLTRENSAPILRAVISNALSIN